MRYELKECLEYSSRKRYIIVLMVDSVPWEVCYCYSKIIAERLVNLLNQSNKNVIAVRD